MNLSQCPLVTGLLLPLLLFFQIKFVYIYMESCSLNQIYYTYKHSECLRFKWNILFVKVFDIIELFVK